MAAQQFCLRWNNHQPNFISVFSNLLNNESLVDVTLAAEGKHLQAHKVVLSACSSYFQSLFTANPCQHPIVILKDIKYADLKTIIDFMYCGEVNVSQDHLPVILKTAETLKIKGLAEMPDQNMLCVTAAESGVGVGAAKGGGEAHSPSMLRRKRLRKSSTESGSTEQLPVVLPAAGACSNEEVLGSAVASSSPVMVKAEVFSESESSLRHEPSTESEPGLASQDSVEEMSEAACSQPSTDQRSHSQGSGHHPRPQNQSSTSSDDKSDAMLGRSSSTEDTSSPSTSSQPHFSSTGDQPGSITMGSKRGRLLLRQHRVKRESELMQGEGGDGGDDATATSIIATSAASATSIVAPRLIERQCSEPTPPQSSPPTSTPNLLAVPQPPFLIKQHSSPQLQIVSSHSYNLQQLGGSPQGQLEISPIKIKDEILSPIKVKEELLSPIKPKEELRRTASSPQCTSSGSSSVEVSGGSRSCHCPVQRPGPALGCNFCWNTIDAHGRILRRKTKYHCPECQTNLCIVPCFQEYHERFSNSNSREISQSSNSSPIVPTIMKTSSM